MNQSKQQRDEFLESLATAIALHQAGKIEEAALRYQVLREASPEDARLAYLLASALFTMGRVEEALPLLEISVKAAPRANEAWFLLAQASEASGNLDRAEAAYARTAELDATSAAARFFLGNLLAARGDYKAASEAFSQAAVLAPLAAEILLNLGGSLKNAGMSAAALEPLERAVALDPRSAAAHNNLGATLGDLGDVDGAIAHYQAALTLDKEVTGTWVNLAFAYKDRGEVNSAINALREALKLDPANARLHSHLLYSLNYSGDLTREEVCRAHTAWGVRGAQQQGSKPPRRAKRIKLRIGYLSADLRDHTVSHFLLPLFEAHDQERFELCAYNLSPVADEMTGRFRKCTTLWRECRALGDDEIAALIRNDEVDLLLDLGGHTADNRLGVFARRAAPVQVSYLGYVNTSGLSNMDFRLTHADADPPGSELYYTERLWRLPGALYCYRPPAAPRGDASPIPPVADDVVSFASLNNFYKVSDAALALWARTLAAIPASRLIILGAPRGRARERVRAVFEAEGVAPERVILQERLSFAEFRACLESVDIAFDTFPFNGGATTCECLHAGVPVLTLVGEPFAARVGYMLNRAVEMPDWNTASTEEFLAIACHWSVRLAELRAARADVRERFARSAIRDENRFCRDIENAFQQMCHR